MQPRARARAMPENENSSTKKPLPDRLSLDPRSPHFDQEVAAGAMVEPHFAGPKRTRGREMLAGNELVAVG